MNISLRERDNRFYAVIGYNDGREYKQKWVSLNLAVKNNKRKAESMLDSVLEDFKKSLERPSSDMLFTDYIKKWLKEKKDSVETSTWEGYQIYAEKHIIPYFEDMKLALSDVKPNHIKDYYQYKFKTGRLDGKSGGLSAPSLKKHGIVLKEVLADAKMNGFINENPAVGVKLPKKETLKVDRVFLTSEQAKLVLSAFKNHNLEPIIYFTLYYGLRRSEVLGLKWNAINFETNEMVIKHTVVKNLTIVAKDRTKTETSYHTYSLFSEAKKILQEIKEKQIKMKMYYGSSYKASDYIFTWEDGQLYRPDYITKAFEKHLVNHGFPKMRFHDLRHSTASILHDLGWDIKDIQEWLRHASIETTADIYTHISESRKNKLALDLEKAITPVSPVVVRDDS